MGYNIIMKKYLTDILILIAIIITIVFSLISLKFTLETHKDVGNIISTLNQWQLDE